MIKLSGDSNKSTKSINNELRNMSAIKAKTSLNMLVERQELLYENIYNLLLAFQQAANNESNSQISVELKNPDGSTKKVTVNSFQQIQRELNRINNNFAQLINENNISYMVNADGTISQYTKTSFANAQYIDLSDISVADTCIVDSTSSVEDLISPMVKIPITIDSSFINTTLRIKSYNITEGFDLIPDNVSYIVLRNLINNGTVVSDKEIERVIEPNREQVRYFGEFNIETIESTSDNEIFNITVDSVTYTGLNVNGSTIELKKGDVLVTSTGSSKWLINDISTFNRILVVQRVSGIESLSVGINKLRYNQYVDTENLSYGLPVKPSQNLVIFISSESKTAVSYPSNGMKISTTDYKVTYNNNTYSIDEFYSTYVTNLADYLMSMAEESTIPYSLGIKPSTPELLQSNFKVVQINKHITSSKSIQDINNLNIQKQQINNEIYSAESDINEIKSNIRSNHYTSDYELKEKQQEIIELQNKIDSLNQNLSSISRRIDSNASQNALKESKAKYKVVGFWSVQSDLYSPSTGKQNIIHYDVQYRYLNQNTDAIENTTMKMIDNGAEVSVVFSAWNNYESSTLNKVKNIDGSVSWEEQSSANIDDININQCLITISENESVEIRVRAVSEAGYPISPMKSEWSNIIRVNFPDDLKENNVNAIVQQNENDIRKSELLNIMKTYGLIDHINTQIIETDRTFVHEAKQLTSGFYTSEMKNIPLDEELKNIVSRIESLEQSYSTKPISISIIDFDSEEFNIENNQNIEIYSGDVLKEFDPKDQNYYGNIVRKKAYIKIKNPNNVSVDIKSLQPNGMSNLDSIYQQVPVLKNSSDNKNSFQQETGQIIYFREYDLSLSENFPLYQKYTKPTFNHIPVEGTNRDNVYYLDSKGNIVKGYADTSTINFPGISLIAPDSVIDKSFFKRIELYNSTLKSDKQIKLMNSVNSLGRLGFSDDDKYAVGSYTTGAFFYPVLGNISRFKVKGDQSTSVMVLSGGQELMIPLVFEYRMFDGLGRLNGEYTNKFEGVTYKKTLGVSMNISNKEFTFDITAYTKI